MVKKLHIILRLLPEAKNVENERIKAEATREMKEVLFRIPWADELESVEVEEAANNNRKR